jgi:hypothetical protein
MTDHGLPAARTDPGDGDPADQLMTEGTIVPAAADPRRILRRYGPRLPVPPGMPPPSEILTDLRANER